MSEALWSPEQHAWLAALGHTVWMRGELAAEPVPRASGPDPVARPARGGRSQAPALPPRPVPAAPAPRAASRMPDRMHIALIRASGCNPNAPDVAAIMASWPPSSELRGNPAAKRALWPRLRALRRGGTR